MAELDREGVFAIVFLVLVEIYFLVFNFFFIWNRKNYPIAQRLPYLAFCQGLWSMLEIINNMLGILVVPIEDGAHCGSFQWILLLAFPFYVNAFFLRMIYLVGNSALQRYTSSVEEVEDKPLVEGLFKVVVYFRNIIKKESLLFIVYLVTAVIYVIFYVLVSIGFDFFENNCGEFLQFEVFRFSLLGLYLIIFIPFIYLLWISEDNFFLKIEFIGTSSSLIIITIIALPILFTTPSVQRVGPIFASVAVFFIFSFVITMPTVLAWYNQAKIEKTASLYLDHPSEPAESDDQNKQKKLTFDDVIGGKVYREEFKKFLQTEFCSENLLFLNAVAKLDSKDNTFQEQCQTIIDDFIVVGSLFEINIPGKLRNMLLESWEIGSAKSDVPQDLFEDAVQTIRDLLFYDTYPRFVKSLK